MKFVSLSTLRNLCIALLGFAALSGAQQPATPGPVKPKIVADLPAGTYAYFQTNYGEFVAKLYTDLAPETTANFIGLTMGTKSFIDPKTIQAVKRPFYDGLTFHRVIPEFMIQGGDPLGTGRGDPGYRFKDEITPTVKFDKAGVLAMANSGPNTNGCQFFITVAPTPFLNDESGHHYSIFGQVVAGLEKVIEISKVPTDKSDPQSPSPLKPIVMEKVRIYRNVTPQAADAKTTGTQNK